MIKARVFFNVCHASLQYDLCLVFKALGMQIVTGNMDRSYEERPEVQGYPGLDYGDEVRSRVDSLSCIESDFEGCDMVFMFNPADFHKRIAHFAQFRPVCMYLFGQWVDNQLDELAGAINGQWDRKEQPRIWVATYSKAEEDYLRPRVYTQLHDRIHHIRYAKRFEDYYPWMVHSPNDDAGFPPERKDYIYTSCNDIHNRGDSCNWKEYSEVIAGLPYRLSGRNTDQVGGQGLLPFDTLRLQMRECAGYMAVPCWPAPIVLNMIEAMMSGAPVAYYDNGRGAAQEGIFDGGVGCLSSDIGGLRSFLNRCLNEKGFREDQSAKSLARARELFEFGQQVKKWEVLFGQMQTLWT